MTSNTNLPFTEHLEKTHDEWIKEAEQELYNALQALESKDLPFVRSCAARAQNYVTMAWRQSN